MAMYGDLTCNQCGREMTLTESLVGHGTCGKCGSVKDERGDVLLKAHDVINGQRQNAYGDPEDSFETIAKLWSVWTGVDLSAHDAAVMMALMKIARMKHGAGSQDSYTDCCGYAALAADMKRASDA